MFAIRFRASSLGYDFGTDLESTRSKTLLRFEVYDDVMGNDRSSLLTAV